MFEEGVCCAVCAVKLQPLRWNHQHQLLNHPEAASTEHRLLACAAVYFPAAGSAIGSCHVVQCSMITYNNAHKEQIIISTLCQRTHTQHPTLVPRHIAYVRALTKP